MKHFKLGILIVGIVTLLSGVFFIYGQKGETVEALKPVKTPPVKEVKDSALHHGEQKQTKELIQPKEALIEPKSNSDTKITKEVSSSKQIIFYKGPLNKKLVALTFDDGPEGLLTPMVLDILKRKNVKGTFFVLGRQAKLFPAVLQRIYREGHVVASHSWNHPQFTKLSNSQITSQLARTSLAIYEIIGKKPCLFRPPYGSINRRVTEQIRKNGCKIIQWSVDTLDWKGRSAAKIERTVMNQIQPGGIILQHTVGSMRKMKGSVNALAPMIDDLRKKGYEFVTVDELLSIPAYHESTYPVYRTSPR